MKKVNKPAALLLALALVLASGALAETGAAPTGAIDLTQICVAVITLIFGVLAKQVWPWIKARTGESQQATLRATAKTLVYAAEQLYKSGLIKDKLTYVTKEIERAGYTFDRNVIEAAVTQLRSETGAAMAETMAAGGCEVANTVELTQSVDGEALASAIAAGIVNGMSGGGGTNEQANGVGAAEAAKPEAIQARGAAAGAGSAGVPAGMDGDAAAAGGTPGAEIGEKGPAAGGEEDNE